MFAKHQSAFFAWLLGIFAFAAGVSAATDRSYKLSPEGKEIVSGELLVKYKTAKSAGTQLEEIAAQKVKSIKGFKTFPHTKLVRFGEDAELEKAMEALKRSGLVEAVSYNYVRKASATTANDPLFDNLSQWGLKNEGQLGGVEGADIGAVEGWDTINATPSIIIAVIDSGIRYTHEDLAANMWVNSEEVPGNGLDDDNNGYIDDVHGINAIDDSGDPMDDHGHGTHVAGIMGAVGDNGVGIAGLVWDVQIMALKFLDENGDGSDADAIQCIDYARSKGAHIINNSWGGEGYNSVMRSKIKDAGDDGIFFIAAAGNESANIDDSESYPASYDLPNIISVTATDRKNNMPKFANFGEDSVDIAAPGVAIYSTYVGSDSDYRILSGTSMATPLVSATIACLLEAFPGESMATTISRLYSSVEVLPSLARRCRTGGRLDFAKALQPQIATPINDAFSKATLVAESQVQTSGFNSTATVEVGEPAHDANASGKSVWWKWVAPLDGLAEVSTAGSDFFSVLGVYSGSSVDSLNSHGNAIEPSVSLASLRGASVTFEASSGTTYYFVVDGYLTDYGNVSLSIGQAVENDNFEDRIRLEGIDIVATANNASATTEAGEGTHAGGAASRSLWWEWTAPNTGYVTFTTASTNSVDTLMGIYVGDSVGSLTELFSDDDSGPGFTSEITEAFVIQGVPYVIAIDGWNGGFGDIALTITHGDNDAFGNARVFVGDEFSDMAFNSRASKEIGEPDHGNNVGGRSLWWEWTATVGGNASVSTLGSDFDTLLGVYKGDDLESLFEIGQSDDDGGSSTSLVLFEAEVGETYRIAVDGFKGDFGHDFGVVRVQGSIFADATELVPVVLDPGTLEGVVGQAFSFNIETTHTTDAYSIDGLPEGLVLDVDTGELTGTPLVAGSFLLGIGATNDKGTGKRLAFLTILPSEDSPDAQFVLSERFGAVGERITLEASLTNVEGASFQWFKDDVEIEGATESTWTIDSLSNSSIGYYSLKVTNAFGSALSNALEVRFSDTRISSISTRGYVRPGRDLLAVEFEVLGEQAREVLIQGLGPSIWSGKLQDVLMDPQLVLIDDEGLETIYDDWEGNANSAEIVARGELLGAKKLSTKNDAAFLTALEPGKYTVVLRGKGQAEGFGLIEAYYADTGETPEMRFANLSTRSWVDGANEFGLSRFLVEGSEPKKILLRAVAPSLSLGDGYDYLSDPYLKLFRGRELIDVNDDWGTGDVDFLRSLTELVGADALGEESLDAVLLVELEPGEYSVRISDLGDSEGLCAFEVYEVN